jgi:uncharacterized protein (TIGR00725 family)
VSLHRDSGAAGGAVPRPLRIGVIGSADADPVSREIAFAVGRDLARAEALLVCGGGGGVMAAAAAGAASEGGEVLGILPGDDPEVAAAGVSIPMPTGLGEARNVLVVKASEAVIAVAGGWGTVNEASLCMKIGRPLIGLRDRLGDNFRIDRYDDAAEAVARALELAIEWRNRRHERMHDVR